MPVEAQPVGLLLAAGSSRRFGGDKLLHPLASALPVAVAALRSLLAGLPRVLAVVRADQTALSRVLAAAGAEPVPFADADRGMGASLAFGVSRLPGSIPGCLVSLADKPFIRSESVAAVRDAFAGREGAVVLPTYRGRRGHPVAFGRAHFPELERLDGDAGGRQFLHAHPEVVETLALDDAGIVRDVDRPEDLVAGPDLQAGR